VLKVKYDKNQLFKSMDAAINEQVEAENAKRSQAVGQ
jgi:hypothetical protein